MFRRILDKIRKDGIWSLFESGLRVILKHVYKPSIIVKAEDIELDFLGTAYGGKKFFNYPELHNGTIISCGLGEDASFDVEFAKKYEAKVIIVDPTPRAVSHFNGIEERIGKNALLEYTTEGAQPVEAYDMSSIVISQMVLEEFALWTELTQLKFFSPKNPSHVSYSITNFQNNYSQSESYDHMLVDTKTLSLIMEEYSLNEIPLLKLDIEGAEIEVIAHMLEEKIYPVQICVEVDGLNLPSRRAKRDYQKLDEQLRSNGYLCYYFDGHADFLYALSARVEQAAREKESKYVEK